MGRGPWAAEKYFPLPNDTGSKEIFDYESVCAVRLDANRAIANFFHHVFVLNLTIREGSGVLELFLPNVRFIFTARQRFPSVHPVYYQNTY